MSREIDTILRNRLLIKQQTAHSNAQPSMEVTAIRPRTPIFHKRFWQESVVATATAGATSVAVRRTGALADRVYVAYVAGGILTVKSAALVYPVSSMAWQVETTISGCVACALEFDGSFIRAAYGKVEFRTDSLPWLFYTTTGGELMAGILGGTYAPISGNVSAFDCIHGVASVLEDIDQGMIAFYIVSGTVFYRQFIAGAWEDQQSVDLAPAVSVAIKAERTFDWRIVLQITDGAGALHEVFTKMAISAHINYEQLTVGIENTVAVYEVAYLDTMSQHEYLTGLIDMAITTLWGLAPEVLSISNEDDGTGDHGFKIRITFDADLFSVSGNEAAFSMVDAVAASYDCTAIEQNGRELILTFEDFNNATNPIILTYTPGTIIGEVELVEAFALEFNATELDPVFQEPPVPVSAENIIDWEAT